MPSTFTLRFAKQNFQRESEAQWRWKMPTGSQAPIDKEESEEFVAVLNRLHGPCARMTFRDEHFIDFTKRETESMTV